MGSNGNENTSKRDARDHARDHARDADNIGGGVGKWLVDKLGPEIPKVTAPLLVVLIGFGSLFYQEFQDVKSTQYEQAVQIELLTQNQARLIEQEEKRYTAQDAKADGRYWEARLSALEIRIRRLESESSSKKGGGE